MAEDSSNSEIYEHADVVRESYRADQFASGLSDEELVEKCNHLIFNVDFMKGTEECISCFFNEGKLDAKCRRKLEGCYIITKCEPMIDEKGNILALVAHKDE